MANVSSNRSPSPLAPRNCRNSETNSTTRRSFNGNPFARPSALVNPRDSNLATPANSPAVMTDHMKRNSIGRRSVGSNSMFKDEKENHIKDVIRSPAKGCSKNFMAPTISAASKFTPSPRKKVLGEKNDLSRASIQFVDKDFDLKPESTTFDQTTKTEEGSQEPITLEQKEEVQETTPVHKVTFSSITDASETLSDVTEISDFAKIRPFCCSPITSPITAPLETNPSLPPYDPKRNFLSPRPQFLRYKPNPRVEILLNKENGKDGHGEEDVTRLDESFNLSDISSDTEEKENEEKPSELGAFVHGSSEDSSEIVSEEKQSELGDLVHGLSEDSSEIVSEEKQSASMVVKPSKPRFFTRSKTVSFLFVMFLVACFSVSFTDSPPMDLPIYKDVSFSEIYHESLKFAAFAKESFDDLVENLKQWSMNLVSYLSEQISHFGSSTHGSIQFCNLTTSPIQEEFIFNRHIGTDYAEVKIREVVQEFEEEIENFEEVDDDDDDEIDAADEFVTEETNNIQPEELVQSDGDGFLETNLNNPEDGLSEIASSPLVSESASEMATNDDVEIESTSADSGVEVSLGTLSSLLNKSINTICLGGFCMVIMAVSAIFYTIKRKSNPTKTAAGRVADYDMCTESSSSGSSSVQKRYKKKTVNDKRESLASSSSSDFSRASPSYGSFTTFERIPIKHGDEVMLTPIRRSSRLLKNQVTSS